MSESGNPKKTPSRIDEFHSKAAHAPLDEGDDLPESAFMYVGNLDDAKRKAEEMAAAVS